MTLAPPAGVHIGPNEFPPPERSLGYQIIAWCREYIRLPDGPNAGDPWEFTREQKLFLCNWYAIDERGRFVYRRGMLRRMKGWGKDPLAAVICCVEFIGPCRFKEFDRNGLPVAVPHYAACVQIAAVSQDQVKRNTMSLFEGLFSYEARREFDLDIGKEQVYAFRGRCRLELLTTSHRSSEGPRPTFILKNETQHWVPSNGGDDMSAVCSRNAAKARDGSTRVLAISNAHNPGEDSDAEHDYETYIAIVTGKSKATGFLYDSLEAPPDIDLADREQLKAGLEAARGDSHWLDIETLIETIYDPTTAPSDARRYYLNQLVAAEDAWLAPVEWDTCGDPDRKVAAKELITLGLDGSKGGEGRQAYDHTALVGCTIDGSHLFTIGIWAPEESPDNLIPMSQVDAAVRRAFEDYDVVGFYSDVKEWETYTDLWEQELAENLCALSSLSHPIKWPMNRVKEATLCAEAFHDAVMEKDLTHEGDPKASQYVYNAKRWPNIYGVTFGKESPASSRKVDWLAAAMLARKARQDYMALPENKKRTGYMGVSWA